MPRHDPFTYRGERTSQISFPLGGIGTGCLGLGGDGRLVDWEIFNRPNKGGMNGFSHFAIRAESRGRTLDARILHGDLQPPYTGSPYRKNFCGVGFGPPRETLAGLPHFRETEFRGTYPIAEVRYREPAFPGQVTLTAWNPFIPHKDRDSGIPAACFEFAIANPTKEPLDYTLAGTLGNPLPADQVHRLRRSGGLSLLHLSSTGVRPGEPAYGDLTLATDAPRVSAQSYWFRGAWFDALEVYWRDLTAPGPFADRRYGVRGKAAAATGAGNQGLLAAHVRVRPGQTGRVRFVIAWNFPVCENYWNKGAAEAAQKAGVPARWRNYYATQWRDSAASAAYALRGWPRLVRETTAFRDALFGSTLPPAVLDAVSANISILKTPTVLRTEDGTFYGFEGCHAEAGCCEGTCTHVWNYAQALPFLFPALERSVREADYRYNQQADGGMPFRLQLPLGIRHGGGRSCADGLFGNVLMVYRDWKASGDTAWLRRQWPAVKKSVEFAWHPDNADRWDPERTGVLWGRQHHTLDMELFGPSSWLCGFYLGALRAGAEMAGHLGDAATQREWTAIFERGRAWVDSHLFNGEYFHQLVDLKDRALAERFGAAATYWSDELGELKYQIGEGCAADQVLAQYHAELYGLGELFDAQKTRRALKALYRHNFKRSMRAVYNPCRLYALNDEGGLAICAWPAGRRKPAIPVPYSQETMHGFEYAAATLMIRRGLVREGLSVVKAVRARYDGRRRNPWNEFECGSNYARSMASYALLHAYAGLQFDLTRGLLGFAPAGVEAGARFACFWSVGRGWGTFAQDGREAVVTVQGGGLALRRLRLSAARGRAVRSLTVGGRPAPFTQEDDTLVLRRPARLRAGGAVRAALQGARSVPFSRAARRGSIAE